MEPSTGRRTYVRNKFPQNIGCSFHISNFHSEAPPEETVYSFWNNKKKTTKNKTKKKKQKKKNKKKTQFSTKANLRAICRQFTWRYTCSSSNKKFPNKKDIESHKRQHHDVTSDKCGRSFGYTSSLTRHKESCRVTKTHINVLFKFWQTICFEKHCLKPSTPTPFITKTYLYNFDPLNPTFIK